MTKQNKDKQIRDANFLVITLSILIIFILVFLIIENHNVTKLEQELQSCQDKVPIKCYFINEVTTRYWIPEENLIVGENTYIENITERSCEVLSE